MGHSIGDLVAGTNDSHPQKYKYIIGWITEINNLGRYHVEWADGMKGSYLSTQIESFKKALATIQRCDKM